MMLSHKSVKWTVTAIAVITAMMLVSAAAQAAIINVPGDQPTIQAGIDAAVNGDEVVVAPGTYNETIDFLGKAITVRSSDGPEVTIVNAQFAGTVVTCSSGEGPDTVLIGFTIWRGVATNGAGMFNLNSSPTVTNCTFSGNTATGPFGFGGGMYNVASGFLDISSPTVTNCTFLENGASFGGGMANVAFGDLAFSSPTVTNCRFLDNSAFFGAGMYNEGSHPFDISSPTVTNCTFSGNTATGPFGFGGGIYNFLNSSPTVTNCTFSGNTAFETGGGMYNNDSSPEVTNCILWGNGPDQIFNDATVSYSDVQGGWPGIGNIDADPLFVDEVGGDYHISGGSPCIDAADNTAVPKGITTDLDGNPRFVDDPDTKDTGNGEPPIVDMGAYEFQGVSYCTWDLNGDGIVGILDLLALLAAWGPNPGDPADFDGTGTVDILDLLTLLANWGPC